MLSNSKLKFIGKKSFYNTKINRLFIPKSVEIIEEGCFNGMPDDLKIELPESNTNMTFLLYLKIILRKLFKKLHFYGALGDL